jgi:hypothetical protein
MTVACGDASGWGPRKEKDKEKMEAFAVGMVLGLAFGVTVVGFLAVGAYDRGFNEALHRRKAWRTELVARQAAAHRVLTSMKRAS